MNIYWIWLSRLKYIGPVLQKRLIKEFGTPIAVYNATIEELQNIKGIGKREIQSILENRHLKEAENILQDCEKKEIYLLTLIDPLYPSNAKICKESPILFYYKGHLRQYSRAIGVVGTRRCSVYGRKVAEEVGQELATAGIPFISGFAKGIDSYGQVACMSKGGYTIAFLAGGVDVCYPSEQSGLYNAVLDKGGVFLSQHPPGTRPYPKQFLQRNAFISAWSTELIVVEAGEKSGALWTADFALKQGKQVYAVPHSIYESGGKGCNNLLTKGAYPYLGIESLLGLHENGVKTREVLIQKKETDPILQLLTQSPKTISFLVQTLKFNESTLMDRLLTLELEGKIVIRGDLVSLF